jgi:hyperosmotically inducible protein
MTRKRFGAMALAMALFASTTATSLAQTSERMVDRIQKQVRKELVTLPFYSVFDNFEFQVGADGAVTLMGQVSRPSLKDSATRVVKRIEGVGNVTNNIEILPLSPNDDRIRLAAFRAIYGHSALQNMAIRAVPPIHIIVKNGNVTLEGVVNTKLEKQVAETQARQLGGVFQVTNNLRVEQDNS